ncbi:aromatic ring-hydroxylating dioxygenase subunit alpha [Dactylococcopsis salina]|uniref:Ring-hydroxylating dioxygenase, large terminal subunit n=1 Tax=Dactylococcopsis salina (strain PCC 8305) TaxID=13035 RepID=K9YTR1_DACS8|nr:aromatic ring-hydroxylating dioxygenase subunit alpha [Dactylococcopsis salina]AFZ50321.1 ring-hydroxylating dioxygenase, large terminal subunit [Dactylococcopsis salina PCC 8305]
MYSVREIGINPNHWYVVARSCEVTTQPHAVTLWKESIVLYRQNDGKICALEDRCPHRFVKLSAGEVQGNYLECAYHGWQFDDQGKCISIPYLTEKQKLPRCQLRRYPVQEADGFIWVFLGEENQNIPRFQIPEWDHLNYIATVSVIETQAHYSYLIENLMDMYHGHLHQDWQAWTDAKLENIKETDQEVHGYYQAQSYYKIDKIWSISQLFFPSLRQLHPEPLTVSYLYPHWVSSLGSDFKIYCLFCPINETSTRAYLIHFTSLNAFWRLHKLPIWFRRGLKNMLFGSAQKLLDGLVHQDVVMMEQEQQAFLENPQQKGYEFNPVLGSVQRLIRKQVELS